MSFEEIKNIVANGESQTVELKKSLTQLKSAMQSACAFLNTGGGIVIIGVSPHGKIIGQAVSDNTQQEIAREIQGFIDNQEVAGNAFQI